jgi:hypothetical protein
MIAVSVSSLAMAQTAPATAPPASPAVPPATPYVQPQPYYAPPPAYPPYPPQGYWIPASNAPLKERSYRPGSPVPPGYHVEERHPKWALITGTTMLASAYATALLYASEETCSTDTLVGGSGFYTSTCEKRWALAVPIVGPFVDMSKHNQGDTLFTDILLAGGEITGAIILTVGLATTTPKLIPDTQGFSMAPLLGPGLAGLSLTLKR